MPAIGKAQYTVVLLPCHLFSLLQHSAFFADSSLRSALAVVRIMDSTPTCADAVLQERLRIRRERERHVAESRRKCRGQ